MAVHSKGTKLYRGDGGGSEVFTAIPGVFNIGGPQRSKDFIESTDLDSTAKEYIAGLEDNGSVNFQLRWEPANSQHIGLETDKNADTLRNFRIEYPTGTSGQQRRFAFAAFIEQLEPSADTNNILTLDCALRVSGAITATTVGP